MKREPSIMSVLLAGAMWTAASAAAVPEQINYQGRLTDGTNLVNGQVELVLGVYDADVDGTLLYADSNTVTVVDGLYATYLGDDTISGTLTGALATAEAWLEVTVNGTPLSPRERLVAVPYALTAAGVADGAITAAMLQDGAVTETKLADGSVTGAKLATNAVGSAQIADGSVTAADVDAASFATTFWSADGNAGTTAGTHFLGTTDDEPLEVKVNNARVLRFEPSDRVEPYSDSPNVIAGHATNTVTAGACGGTIAGGGSSGGAWNRVTDDFGTIGGGRNNQAGDDTGTISNAWFATVGGGRANIAAGPESVVAGGTANQTEGEFAFVGGGTENLAAGPESVVAGGQNNQAFGGASAVLGGSGNIATGTCNVVCGGTNNQTIGFASSVLGGVGNTASGNYSMVCGGTNNLAGGARSLIGGGTDNETLPTGYSAMGSVILNGDGNQAASQYSFVGNGYRNSALGFRSAIASGEHNIIHDTSWFGFIGCGDENEIYTNYSAIVCGYQNTASNNFTFIGGGRYNLATGAYSSVLGGRGNTAAGNYSSVGGYQNIANGIYSTVGGYQNTVDGPYGAVGGGMQAAATHFGEWAHASGDFAERGDAQSSEYVLRRTSSGTTQIALYLNGGDGDPLTLASNRVVAFEALITAAADNGSAAVYKYSGGIKRVGEDPVQMIGTVSEDLALENESIWSVSIDANAADNSLRFRVTGATGRSIRWVATVRTTETVIP